jgi:hypothetical protein
MHTLNDFWLGIKLVPVHTFLKFLLSAPFVSKSLVNNAKSSNR